MFSGLRRSIQKVLGNYDKRVAEAVGQKTYNTVHRILSIGAENAKFYTPVDTSNLVNSQYSPIITQSGGQTQGYVGYTAEYAFWVHEMPGTMMGQPRPGNRGNYWDPAGAQPQFLTKGFQEGEDDFKKVIKEFYRV